MDRPTAPILVATLPEGAKLVSMVVWRDMVIACTSDAVYALRSLDEGFVPVEIQHEGER